MFSFIHSFAHLATNNSNNKKKVKGKRKFALKFKNYLSIPCFLGCTLEIQSTKTLTSLKRQETNNLFLKLEKKTKDEYPEVIQGNLYHTSINQLLKQANNNWQCKEFKAR